MKTFKKMLLQRLRELRLFLRRNSWIKKMIGVAFVLFGFIAFITPITPGSWIAIIGLELMGIQILSEDVRKKYKARIINAVKKFLQ